MFVTSSMNKEKKVGDNIHPCFSPMTVGNSFEILFPSHTDALVSLYKSLIILMKLYESPISFNLYSKAFLSILSKADFKSMKKE